MSETEDQPLPLSPRGTFFTEYWWLAFLGPLVVYMAFPMAFSFEKPGEDTAAAHLEGARQVYASGLLNMTTMRALMLVPIVIFLARAIHWPRFRVSWLAVVVGVVGVVLWVGIDAIGLRQWAASLFGEESYVGGFLFPARDATNPYELYGDNPSVFWLFMAARFTGLVLIVPLCEELMLRGWLMRMVDNGEFWKVPFGEVTLLAAAVGVGFEVLIHPEKLAAVVWFSLTTWLMFKTKNFWDCFVAHAVTNFLLGVWVCWSGQWELW